MSTLDTDTLHDYVLEVKNLKTYFYLSRGTAKAVDDISFNVKRGEILGLVGESGCGKTVTCLSIMGLLPTSARVVSGQITLDGENLYDRDQRYSRGIRGRKISMILQDPSTSLNPVYTIGSQVAEALKVKYDLKGITLRSNVVEWLEVMRIPNPERRLRDYPHQMSGGMKQRVAGAIALSVAPKLVIADEPTTALDVTIQAQYLLEIKKLQQEFSLSIIFVTHDLGIVAAVCDRVCVMYAGRIVEQAGVEELFQNNRHPYTLGLLNSLPKLGHRVDRLPMIPGEPPSLLRLPDGCRFSSRCPLSKPRCQSQTPPMVEISNGHFVSCWEVI